MLLPLSELSFLLQPDIKSAAMARSTSATGNFPRKWKFTPGRGVFDLVIYLSFQHCSKEDAKRILRLS
jgi:hypothetical protein